MILVRSFCFILPIWEHPFKMSAFFSAIVNCALLLGTLFYYCSTKNLSLFLTRPSLKMPTFLKDGTYGNLFADLIKNTWLIAANLKVSVLFVAFYKYSIFWLRFYVGLVVYWSTQSPFVLEVMSSKLTRLLFFLLIFFINLFINHK